MCIHEGMFIRVYKVHLHFYKVINVRLTINGLSLLREDLGFVFTNTTGREIHLCFVCLFCVWVHSFMLVRGNLLVSFFFEYSCVFLKLKKLKIRRVG